VGKTSTELIVERLRDRTIKARAIRAGFTQKVEFKTTPEMHQKLRDYAQTEGVGVSEVIRHAINLLIEGE
jgi:hypothetical protein